MTTESRKLANRSGAFPALYGNADQDTEALIGELSVGEIVTESGWARLFLIYSSKQYLDIKSAEYKCQNCGLLTTSEEKGCPRCGSAINETLVEMFPTLQSYITYIADRTGKSRQTIFNRLRVYRVLCESRNVNPRSVFVLNVISPGAASALARVDDDATDISLEDGSWQKTVDTAIGFDSKRDALAYIRHDILHKPSITASITGENEITIYLEPYSDEDIVVHEYKVILAGEWHDEVLEWLTRRLGAKVPD